MRSWLLQIVPSAETRKSQSASAPALHSFPLWSAKSEIVRRPSYEVDHSLPHHASLLGLSSERCSGAPLGIATLEWALRQ